MNFNVDYSATKEAELKYGRGKKERGEEEEEESPQSSKKRTREMTEEESHHHRKESQEDSKRKPEEYQKRQKLIDEVRGILKIKEAVRHPQTQRQESEEEEEEEADSSTDTDSESERIIQILREAGGEEKTQNEDNVDGPRKRQKSESLSEEEEEEEDGKRAAGKTKKKVTKGAAVYEDQPVEPSTRRGEDELEKLFEINTVRNFPKRVAEDVAKILEEKYGLAEGGGVKKMPARKRPASKKRPSKKKKSAAKKGKTLKISPALMRTLKTLSKKKK